MDKKPRSRLWTNPSFCWLFVASAISILGNQFSLVAIPWLALQLTGSSSMLAASFALMALPQVIVILIGGVAADRFSPKAILAITNLTNTVLLATLASALVTGTLRGPMLLLLALLMGAASAFAVPAARSLLPRIVPMDLLVSANSLSMMARQLATLLGPVTAGALIGWVSARAHPAGIAFPEAPGIAAALAIDATTFAISAALLCFVQVLPAPQTPRPQGMLKPMAEGIRWLWSDRPLRTLLFYYSSMMVLVAGPAQVGLPIIVNTVLGHAATGLGILMASLGLGTIGGMAIAGLRSRRQMVTLGIKILAVDAIGGLSLLMLPQTHSIVVAAALCVIVGVGGGYVQIGIMTWIQQRIPLHMLGRAMSVMMLIILGTVPLSATVTGALLTLVSISAMLTGSGALLMSIALFCLSSTTLRSIDQPQVQNSAA